MHQIEATSEDDSVEKFATLEGAGPGCSGGPLAPPSPITPPARLVLPVASSQAAAGRATSVARIINRDDPTTPHYLDDETYQRRQRNYAPGDPNASVKIEPRTTWRVAAAI